MNGISGLIRRGPEISSGCEGLEDGPLCSLAFSPLSWSYESQVPLVPRSPGLQYTIITALSDQGRDAGLKSFQGPPIALVLQGHHFCVFRLIPHVSDRTPSLLLFSGRQGSGHPLCEVL